MPNFRKPARPRMPAFALQLQGLEERLPHLLENGCASIARNLARCVAFAPLACTAGSWHWLKFGGPRGPSTASLRGSDPHASLRQSASWASCGATSAGFVKSDFHKWTMGLTPAELQQQIEFYKSQYKQ